MSTIKTFELENESDSEDSKEVEVCVKVSKPFMETGDSTDEIVLSFDGGKKLFVSENFLSYASPVFQAMFRHDFREKETREVALKEKSFEDFHEFLLCLHPGVQKPVDKENVLRIVALAVEYQVYPTVRKCQEVLTECLERETESATRANSSSKRSQCVATCLNILTKAVDFGFTEVTSYAIGSIARFGYKIFTGTPRLGITLSGKEQSSNRDCVRLYSSLPEEIKSRLLLERLKYCDDNQMR